MTNERILFVALMIALGIALKAEREIGFLEGQKAGVIVTVSREDDGTGPDYKWTDNKPTQHKSHKGAK